mmetsp:Transcript_75136/g.132781  ORF Transcript_75136/g.132781 Transcript_75136/m.132781 type:complete len:111 (-) Transcript_75136:61-393(-)|eukprot:CAMPEP_0197691956 /NCGR_PEP_ID=MMETSP1338-20131121/110448_1 /TAXON_ID=43686 ORGANISM="Pelagodinium beii, Strain RCC1491" /NCGR_SAMPLE_ID=MMETSP1338 /ASSEMBLY_ACC=CAM_ASM_000754 /LENGTH=110 /DNA_ID=CAMNT_0043274565 /DNA_START=3 /DNA_END=335 /DNA_ORIENTATION=-
MEEKMINRQIRLAAGKAGPDMEYSTDLILKLDGSAQHISAQSGFGGGMADVKYGSYTVSPTEQTITTKWTHSRIESGPGPYAEEDKKEISESEVWSFEKLKIAESDLKSK